MFVCVCVSQVIAFCRNHPDVRSWLSHHDDSPDARWGVRAAVVARVCLHFCARLRLNECGCWFHMHRLPCAGALVGGDAVSCAAARNASRFGVSHVHARGGGSDAVNADAAAGATEPESDDVRAARGGGALWLPDSVTC
jgi:hypothetical protein